MEENKLENSEEDLKSKITELEKERDKYAKQAKGIRNAMMRMTAITLMSLFLGTCCLVVWSIYDSESVYLDKKYTNKERLKSTIAAIARNNGDLGIIKHAFDSKQLEPKPFYKRSSEYLQSHYPENVSLSFVLDDLMADYYKRKDFSLDLPYINKLKQIKTENNLINPFDRLDDNQKYHFDNIRSKLDSTYVLIQPDISKITEELNSKNQLVNKYLNKSELSFKISIIALVATLIISAYQIRQGNRSNRTMKRMFAEATKIRVGDNVPVNTYCKTRADGSKTYVICTEMEALKRGLEDREYKAIVVGNKHLDYDEID